MLPIYIYIETNGNIHCKERLCCQYFGVDLFFYLKYFQGKNHKRCSNFALFFFSMNKWKI